MEMCDLMLNPPQEDTYLKLKGVLINRTTALNKKRLQLLFTAEELGNRKPTRLLR